MSIEESINYLKENKIVPPYELSKCKAPWSKLGAFVDNTWCWYPNSKIEIMDKEINHIFRESKGK